jgi:hypothetical protein
MAGEAVVKVFGSKPSEPSVDWGSGTSCGGAGGLGVSVMVLDDDACEGDDDGRGAWGRALALSAGRGGGGEGEDRSSSGFAMRSPPRDCERLKSPFIIYGGRWAATKAGRGRAKDG